MSSLCWESETRARHSPGFVINTLEDAGHVGIFVELNFSIYSIRPLDSIVWDVSSNSKWYII